MYFKIFVYVFRDFYMEKQPTYIVIMHSVIQCINCFYIFNVPMHGVLYLRTIIMVV